MYCLLKSQLDGKPFLVTSVDNESDIERIEDFVWALQQVEAEEALKGRSEIQEFYMKYDISDIIKLCNENPMNAVWQIIELSTGKVFPVTGFSGTLWITVTNILGVTSM